MQSDLRAMPAGNSCLTDLDIADLAVAEQLIVWALRTRLEKGPDGPIISGFHVAFGVSTMEAALACFESMFLVLQDEAHRVLAVHAPRCRHVSRDEMMVTGLIALMQRSRVDQARRVAARLIGTQAFDTFIDQTRQLAAMLTRQRLHMPLRLEMLQLRPELRVLH